MSNQIAVPICNCSTTRTDITFRINIRWGLAIRNICDLLLQSLPLEVP